MRLIRLRLANYRGINESEILFGPNGLTVVEGPNEAGKTSLGESVRLLFEYLDSSKHSAVKATKPVTKDVGTEIELEARSGSYVFTYFKRFHKKPETALTITEPKSENYTGREAHERAEQILQETIDVALWKALSIQQGDAVQQADLTKQTSLSTALDAVAGGHRADPREESLFDKVRGEYDRYFTAGGKEKKDLLNAREALEKSESKVTELEGQIRDLEQDVKRASELARELESLEEQEQGLKSDVSEYTKALDEIKVLETALATVCLKLESARKDAQTATRDKEKRQGLIDRVAVLREGNAELEEVCTSSAESAKVAEQSLEQITLCANEAESEKKEADSLLSLRRADFDYFNNRLHLEQLRERKVRIDRAREETVIAEESLAKNKVDEHSLEEIQAADHSLIAAQAKLDLGAPSILLKGLEDLGIQIDGEKATLSKDQEKSLSVSDRVRVLIPGVLEMEVSAGSSSSKLSEAVGKANEKLVALCREVGASDVDKARQFHDARREALRTLEQQSQIEEENLRDLTYGELEKKTKRLENVVPGYPKERIQHPQLPKSLEDSKRELCIAEGDLEEANKAWEKTRTELEAARDMREGQTKQHEKVRVELDIKERDLGEAVDELSRSRQSTSDEKLKSAYSQSVEFVRAEERKMLSAETTLGDKEPERVRGLCETAKGSLETVEKKRTAAQDEKIELRTRLSIHGEEGLHEKLNAAKSGFDYASRETAAMVRRAEAAKLLFITMKAERDKARRAYVAPLKERVEGLGRLVFGKTFEVEVNEDLSVAGRVMDGANVPFDSLSGGTKEQISLISRLACAMLVSSNGGAPLILDDELGYTDPERLRLMGAVLAKAAKDCQIIILTCVPERYAHVGAAEVKRLG